jgi:DNA polymerase II
MTESFSGWLLDLYEASEGVTLWLLGDDGQRRRFTHDFPVTFYAAGPAPRLRLLWKMIQQMDNGVVLARSERRDLFSGVIPVLSATTPRPAALQTLFQQIADSQPGLTYYDADIPLALRYAARFDVFPLARCRIEAEAGRVVSIEPHDTSWDLDPLPAPLRILSLEPDRDPLHANPKGIIISYDKVRYTQPLEPVRALLINLRAVLERYDPDLILTSWGDTWLLPLLILQSQKLGLPLPLNRDPAQEITLRKAHTYFSYGQIVYRGQQVQLYGRWHLDRHNAMLWSDYALDGVLEMARVTALPVQDAARLSPGTGISSMQFTTALRRHILIPWHKAQAETPKTALDLIHSDMGGLVYQPTVGLHRDVGGIDFASMYPGIMVHFNISPEVPRSKNGDLTPAPGEPGLIPQTLAPLLEKRLRLKAWVNQMHPRDPRREIFKARASAAKWLLVTCFGYLGYKNARFGRIEAHEAVTAYGREALLRAKEASEDLGYLILHMYVDGLWVCRDGCRQPQDFDELLKEISARTDLPIALDGIYRWVVFLPSRVDDRVPVANRYFGVFQDGSLKVRGIECRRRDTPLFISELQMDLLSILARAPDADHLADCLPPARALLDRRLNDLRAGRVPLEKLLLAQKLSRELEDYRSPSPAARAAQQLAKTGKTLRPGQRVRFLLTRGEPGIHAWDLPEPPDPRTLDVPRYRTLLLRAAETVLKPMN